MVLGHFDVSSIPSSVKHEWTKQSGWGISESYMAVYYNCRMPTCFADFGHAYCDNESYRPSWDHTYYLVEQP